MSWCVSWHCLVDWPWDGSCLVCPEPLSSACYSPAWMHSPYHFIIYTFGSYTCAFWMYYDPKIGLGLWLLLGGFPLDALASSGITLGIPAHHSQLVFELWLWYLRDQGHMPREPYNSISVRTGLAVCWHHLELGFPLISIPQDSEKELTHCFTSEEQIHLPCQTSHWLIIVPFPKVLTLKNKIS